MCYENQDEVGAALKKIVPSVVKREDLFLTSKLWNTAHRPELVEKELDETLKQLGVDYLDLYRTYPCHSDMPIEGQRFGSDALASRFCSR